MKLFPDFSLIGKSWNILKWEISKRHLASAAPQSIEMLLTAIDTLSRYVPFKTAPSIARHDPVVDSAKGETALHGGWWNIEAPWAVSRQETPFWFVSMIKLGLRLYWSQVFARPIALSRSCSNKLKRSESAYQVT